MKKTASDAEIKSIKRSFLWDFFVAFKATHYIIALVLGIIIGVFVMHKLGPVKTVVKQPILNEYWLKLERKSGHETLFKGIPGDANLSKIVRVFKVKTGVAGQKPTPLPQYLGRKYWKIVKKYPTENPETAPYFLELDIPAPQEWPFGPMPYTECNGEQCSWEIPGAFGLHGVNGDMSRLSSENPGSSGCIRHSSEDITYLYNLLLVDEGVRYYITDS